MSSKPLNIDTSMFSTCHWLLSGMPITDNHTFDIIVCDAVIFVNNIHIFLDLIKSQWEKVINVLKCGTLYTCIFNEELIAALRQKIRLSSMGYEGDVIL